ncbi:MAG: spore coat U domain-containing protein [Paralcaligenes sp.]
MQTVVLPVKCLGKAACYGCSMVIFMWGLFWGGLAHAAPGMTCTVTGTPSLNLGSVNVLGPPPAAVSAGFTYSCNVSGFAKKGYGQICFSVGTGSASSNYNPRQLQLTGDTTKKLNFDIYQDTAGTLWGYRLTSASGDPVVVGFQAANNGKVTVTSTNTPIPALVSAAISGQNTASAGAYTSSFSAANAVLTWSTLPSSTLNPASCGTSSVGSFAFSVSASVPNMCNVTTSDLNFGAVSSMAAGPITGSSTLNVQCTNGTLYQVGLSNGINGTGGTNRSMKNTSTATLVSYDLYQDAARSVRWGNNSAAGGDTLNGQSGTGIFTPVTVYGRAFPTAAVTAGNYADTVTVTLYY